MICLQNFIKEKLGTGRPAFVFGDFSLSRVVRLLRILLVNFVRISDELKPH